ncbi:hypothetical protein CGLO_13026 [Colletotrichum gloeosporioides Cg-14]|uniref:Uncharacterized protein n=1 Tax=Colletotrichum gloeosporioides (strain Cg-14) TaxID=1237896 RepID=T0JXB1_COLGC|nr:hypothetical protein CGLO_13026 [Colletotrichum gloeosporioides Cg-14]
MVKTRETGSWHRTTKSNVDSSPPALDLEWPGLASPYPALPSHTMPALSMGVYER